MARASFQKIKLLKKKNIGIVAITAYDASFARYFDELGFDIILIGDSLGEVIKGQKNTHNVSLENMIYHSQSVRRAVKNSYLISDLPRESSLNKFIAYKHAKKIISECKVNMIKIECNKNNIDVVEHLVKNKIPICCHLGLTPQLISQKNSFRKYGKSPKEFSSIIKIAQTIQEVGVKMILIECVTDLLAKELRKIINVPIIGIGSGKSCDGQILVSYDILGISYNSIPKIVEKKYFKIKDFESRVKKYIYNTKNFL
jgi:3-methyl-2-oxobutanoate hydroxymethyltransferase